MSLDDPRYGFSENFGVSVASLSSTGIWLNNGTGDGLTLHYNLNGTYIPVQLAQGGYLDISFDALSKITKSNLGQGGLSPKNIKSVVSGAVQPGNTATNFTGSISPAGSEFPGLDPNLMQGGNQ